MNKDRGLLGSLCDFNDDGELDSMEKTADFILFNEIMNDEDEKPFSVFDCEDDYSEDT